MQLADLQRALDSEVKTGKLGVPVALRIHATMPLGEGDIHAALGFFRPFFSLLGNSQKGDVQAKRHPSGQQLAILWTEETRKTAFLTLACSPNMKRGLHLLLIGNHGMTQLQGGEAWSDSLSGEIPGLWEHEIQESLRKGTSIPVRAS
jgi:hypothetical protein